MPRQRRSPRAVCAWHEERLELLEKSSFGSSINGVKEISSWRSLTLTLKDKYGQFELKSNKSSYLGMEIESLADNSISIKQSGYLQSILSKCEYKSTHVTPSTADFFESIDDPKEDYTSNSTKFKSLLMSGQGQDPIYSRRLFTCNLLYWIRDRSRLINWIALLDISDIPQISVLDSTWWSQFWLSTVAHLLDPQLWEVAFWNCYHFRSK